MTRWPLPSGSLTLPPPGPEWPPGFSRSRHPGPSGHRVSHAPPSPGPSAHGQSHSGLSWLAPVSTRDPTCHANFWHRMASADSHLYLVIFGFIRNARNAKPSEFTPKSANNAKRTYCAPVWPHLVNSVHFCCFIRKTRFSAKCYAFF